MYTFTLLQWLLFSFLKKSEHICFEKLCIHVILICFDWSVSHSKGLGKARLFQQIMAFRLFWGKSFFNFSCSPANPAIPTQRSCPEMRGEQSQLFPVLQPLSAHTSQILHFRKRKNKAIFKLRNHLTRQKIAWYHHRHSTALERMHKWENMQITAFQDDVEWTEYLQCQDWNWCNH